MYILKKVISKIISGNNTDFLYNSMVVVFEILSGTVYVKPLSH